MTNSQSKPDCISNILEQMLVTKFTYLGDVEIKKGGESYMFYAYDVEGEIDLEFNHTSVAYVPDSELGTHWVGYNCADDANEGGEVLFKAILMHNLIKANKQEYFTLIIDKISEAQSFWKK